jgi:ureidoglycolate lyase
MLDEIPVRRLLRESFKPFGDIIEVDDEVEGISINNGFATRYNDLARVDVQESGGRPLISIFRCRPRPLPITIHMMERHSLASQAFIPLHKNPFLIVVALPGERVEPESLSAFVTNGQQGVNYARGVWHFPLIGLREEQDFLVVDRGGDGNNCDEFYFNESERRIIKRSLSS